MAERRSPKAALRLAQLALETLEEHGRKPELAVDAFISTVRANSGAAINQLLLDEDLRPTTIWYLKKMAACLEEPSRTAAVCAALYPRMVGELRPPKKQMNRKTLIPLRLGKVAVAQIAVGILVIGLTAFAAAWFRSWTD
jgi:hypothetical protein